MTETLHIAHSKLHPARTLPFHSLTKPSRFNLSKFVVISVMKFGWDFFHKEPSFLFLSPLRYFSLYVKISVLSSKYVCQKIPEFKLLHALKANGIKKMKAKKDRVIDIDTNQVEKFLLRIEPVTLHS